MHTRIIEKSAHNLGFAFDDRIFLGEGLFETLRVDSSKPCFAYLHWQRMSNSAAVLGIPFEVPFDDWLGHLIQQIKCDNLYHGGIKVILSGGVAPRGLVERGQVSQLMMQSFNYKKQLEPVRLVSASWLRDAANPVYQLKSVNYLEAILARRQALVDKADDALFFNTQYHATETTCANLFIVKNNCLFTPAQTEGILPGITRLRVINQCKAQHISCIEDAINKERIWDADAIFITNSLQNIRYVAAIDKAQFNIKHALVEQLSASLTQEPINS